MGLGFRILKNTTYLTLGDKVGYILQFIFFLYFARKYGVVSTGEYSFAFFYGYALSIFSNFGISFYLIREVAASNQTDRRLFSACLITRIISTCIIFTLGFVIAYLLFNDVSKQKLFIIFCWGIYWLFFNIADTLTSELVAHEKMSSVALLGFVLKLMSAMGGIFLIYVGLDYDLVMLSFPVSSFLYLILCFWISFHYLGGIRIKIENREYYKKLFRSLLPFFLALILTEVLFFQDVLLLGFIKSDESVGLYSSAIKIISFILGVSVFLTMAILPALSRLYVESKSRLIHLTETSIRFLINIGLPMSFGLTMTSRKIINLLYSDQFAHCNIILQIASWTILMGFLQALLSAVLTAIDRQKEKVFYMGITFLASLFFYAGLIYKFDYLGAAIAYSITSFISLIFFTHLVSKYLYSIPIYSKLFKPTLACIIMSLFIYFFDNFSVILIIPLSAVIYVLSLVLLKAFNKEEMNFIMNTITVWNKR